MTFNGQYLTYSEYTGLGGTLSQTPFNLLEFEVRKAIDRRTQNRLTNLTTIPDEVKLCVFSLINKTVEYDSQEGKNKNISSESVDGYSVSFATGTQIKDIINAKDFQFEEIMLNYLSNTIVNGQYVLYLGVE